MSKSDSGTDKDVLTKNNEGSKFPIEFQPVSKRFKIWLSRDKCWATWYDRYIGETLDTNQLSEFVSDWNNSKVSKNEEDGDGLVIIQSTNLFDIHNNEIFEGSIVKAFWGFHANGIYVDNEVTGIVKMKDGVWCIMIDGDDKEWIALYELQKDDIILLGHIFSSPELLETIE